MSKLFVDEIVHQSSQGSGTITLGASGEKVDLGTGVSGGTLTNRPAFKGITSTEQTISHATWTNCTYSTEDYDTDNAFVPSTGTFTVPSGKAGVYFFRCGVYSKANEMNDGGRILTRLRLNGGDLPSPGALTGYGANYSPKNSGTLGVWASSTLNLSVGDTVLHQVFQDTGSNLVLDDRLQEFQGYRLIGA